MSGLKIKRMGELDSRAFQEICAVKFSNEDWQEISARLCAEWVETVQDPHWHPFKNVTVNNQLLVRSDHSFYKFLVFYCTIMTGFRLEIAVRKPIEVNEF